MTSAVFARVHGVPIPLRTRHTRNGELLPVPSVVVATPAEPPDRGWFLIRFADGGAFCGDTWHESTEDARAQAEWDCEGLIDNWRPVPPGEQDAAAYALRFVDSSSAD